MPLVPSMARCHRMTFVLAVATCMLLTTLSSVSSNVTPQSRPNIVVVMTDDQGWGQTGYNGHPDLKTPNLDAMAMEGLRLDRFYTQPICTPARASLLTGRIAKRTGAHSVGWSLRKQEKTIASAVKTAGYATAHFGKWHLDGVDDFKVPIVKEDPLRPSTFGFDEYSSSINYVDGPRWTYGHENGEIETYTGDTSDTTMAEAMRFMEQSVNDGTPFLAVICASAPHNPYYALPEDVAQFAEATYADGTPYSDKMKSLHGELVGFDRSVGTLRQRLRDLGIANNTILWYNSDNGASATVLPNGNGGLRGFKGTSWEGGIRVPCLIEWPGVIQPRISDYPAHVMDLFPTIVDVLDLDSSVHLNMDGTSLVPLFEEREDYNRTIVSVTRNRESVAIQDSWKLYCPSDVAQLDSCQLFDVSVDVGETVNLRYSEPERAASMYLRLAEMYSSVAASDTGADYAEGFITEWQYTREWEQTPFYDAYSQPLCCAGIVCYHRPPVPCAVRMPYNGLPTLSSAASSGCAHSHEMVGRVAEFSTISHGVSGLITIVDDCRLEITQFFYDARVVVGVQVWGEFAATDGGSSLSSDLFRSGAQSTPYNGDVTIYATLPVDTTWSDFSSISVRSTTSGDTFGLASDFDFRTQPPSPTPTPTPVPSPSPTPSPTPSPSPTPCVPPRKVKKLVAMRDPLSVSISYKRKSPGCEAIDAREKGTPTWFSVEPCYIGPIPFVVDKFKLKRKLGGEWPTNTTDGSGRFESVKLEIGVTTIDANKTDDTCQRSDTAIDRACERPEHPPRSPNKMSATHDSDGLHLSYNRRSESKCEVIKAREKGTKGWSKLSSCYKGDLPFEMDKFKLKRKLGGKWPTTTTDGSGKYSSMKLEIGVKSIHKCGGGTSKWKAEKSEHTGA
eukprot:TRINITY_DN2118_c0_g1_i2.p1 TRINITY_DN2118_c0_g1~~TRINITY_DN2118_c0_g1_i2.p1  ORF type:complete len:899 (+),score=99.18 TRINITY_DN2118_c0_g1_i2:90-2786(+)